MPTTHAIAEQGYAQLQIELQSTSGAVDPQFTTMLNSPPVSKWKTSLTLSASLLDKAQPAYAR
jgi:hypothetical protein